MRVGLQCGSKMGAMLGVLCIASALLWSSATKAETHVYLLRGWFGVFSTGLDSLADELRSKGVKAEAVGHLAWKSTVSNIIKDRTSSKSGPLVLVGHSQGAPIQRPIPFCEIGPFRSELFIQLLLGCSAQSNSATRRANPPARTGRRQLWQAERADGRCRLSTPPA